MPVTHPAQPICARHFLAPKLALLFKSVLLLFLGCVATNGQTLISLEAESGQLAGVSVSTSIKGYSGSGYVTGFDNTGDSVRWNFNSSGGLYQLRVQFRSPFGPKGFDVRINNTTVSGTFPQSTSFAIADVGMVELLEGSNACELGGGWNWYEVDRVDFMKTNAPPPPGPVPAVPADSQATYAARMLMRSLVADYGKLTWSGQAEIGEIAHVFNATGQKPAIVSGDLIDYSPSRVAFGSNPGNLTESLIALESAGHVNSLSWHWNAPSGLLNTAEEPWWRGFYTSATTFNIAAALDNTNSVQYQEILRDIDAIAVQLRKFANKNIPVLWRPLHEAEGGWFWWGAQGPEPYKKLWRLLFQRLTTHHQLHHLLWVLTSEDPDWYPGHEFVDIVGVDAYPSDRSDPLSGRWAPLRARLDGIKLIALTEFGGVPDVERMHRFGVWPAYFAPWSGTYGPSSMPAETVSRIYHWPGVATLEQLNARAPVFDACRVGANQAIRLSGTGPRGAGYRIVSSPTLVTAPDSWSQTSTGVFSGGVFESVVTPNSSPGPQFFRVRKR